MNQDWISINERLPEDGQYVIVPWSNFRSEDVGFAWFEKDSMTWYNGDEYDNVIPISEAPYWIPAPKLPEVLK